jgi:hypothetical protein
MRAYFHWITLGVTLLLQTLSPVGAADLDPTCASVPKKLTSESQLGIQKLKAFARCNGLKDNEAVLKALPKDFRSRYLLMHHSLSVHQASHEFPRMIFFTEDARFVLSIQSAHSGISKKESPVDTDVIEMIEFVASDDAQVPSRFEFSQLLLAVHGEERPADAKPPIRVNCSGCHRADLGPNWSNYPIWPGAYGGGESYSPFETVALEKLKNFAKGQNPKSTRLKALEGFGSKDSVDFAVNNLRFGEAIGKLNRRRLVENVKAHPDYRQAQYMITAAAKGCPNLESGLPTSRQVQFSTQLIQLKAKLRRETSTQFLENELLAQDLGEFGKPNGTALRELIDPNEEWLFYARVKPMIAVQVTTQTLLGLDLERFSMSHDSKGRSSVFYSDHTLNAAQYDLIEQDLEGLHCGELLEKSRNLFKGSR